jgi:small-conductance mechanosensitive channel
VVDTLNKMLADLITAVTEFVPRLFGAVVVVLVTLIVAKVLQHLASRLLEALGVDELAERTGTASSLRQIGYNRGPSRLLGLVLFWAVLLSGVAGALGILGISSLEQAMGQLVSIFGRALVALVIMIAGIMAAGWLARGAENAGLRGSNVFRRIVFVAVVAVTALVAAGQLGIETSYLVLLSIVLFATVGLVTALVLGQGLVPLSGNIAAARYVREDITVGDEISVDGIEGTVEELGHSAIILRSQDGYLYRIPNRTLLEGVVRKRVQ